MTGFQNRVHGVNVQPPRTIQWRNTLERFGLRAQLLHALIGLAVMIMLVVGATMERWPKAWQGLAFTLHKGLGLWVLLLGILWFLHWRWQPTPAILPNQPKPEYRLAKLVHVILLFLCIAMPLSGWVMVSAWGGKAITMAPYIHIPAIAKTDPAFAKAMQGVHIIFAWSLFGLLALHILAALYHHFRKRDPILKRIIPRFRPPAGYYRFQFDGARREAKKLK